MFAFQVRLHNDPREGSVVKEFCNGDGIALVVVMWEHNWGFSTHAVEELIAVPQTGQAKAELQGNGKIMEVDFSGANEDDTVN